jgi:lantibiotic modifying enzyme
MAWGFLHLAKAGLLEGLEADAQGIVEDLDEPLFSGAMNSLREGDYDYLHGGLGEILYFLERTPNPNIHRYIKSLVVQLEKMAVPSPHGGITWIAPKVRSGQTDDEARYNLGLSHGVDSIVAVLALAYEKGYERERCHKLILLSLEWMWNVRNRQDLSTFPTMVTDVLQDQHSRLAWCYGDLGVASAFYLAGEKLGYKPWKDIALLTIHKSTLRREFADTTIRDSAICHGSAGVAHMYRRFAEATGNPLFHSTAGYWLTDTLRRARPETEANVFLQVTSAAADPYTPSLSLLEGEASIGMVLLTALGAPAHWDRFLLLS